MPGIHLNVQGLNVRIRVDAPACRDGVRALTCLFPQAVARGEPDLDFGFEQEGSLIRLVCNGEQAWQGEESGELIAAFEWAFYSRCIDRLFPRFVSLHAASIDWQGKAVTIAGHSGAGKSSLCTAALLGGAAYFSDEYSLLDSDGRIAAFPRPLQWGGESHPAFSLQQMREIGLFGEGRYRFTGHDGQAVTSLLWHPAKLAREPRALGLLVLPRFDAEACGTHIETVPRSQALLELAAEMHHKLEPAERMRELHRRVPGNIPIHRLIFSDARLAWSRVAELV